MLLGPQHKEGTGSQAAGLGRSPVEGGLWGPWESRELGVPVGGHMAPPSGDAVQDAQREGESSWRQVQMGQNIPQDDVGTGPCKTGALTSQSGEGRARQRDAGSLSATAMIRPPTGLHQLQSTWEGGPGADR